MSSVIQSSRRVLMLSLIASSVAAVGCKSQSASGGGEALRIISTAHGTYIIEGPRVTTYVAADKAACPDCTKAAHKYAMSGTLDPWCDTCKAPRKLMTSGPRP
jgi:hypothetical protein